MPIDFSLFRNRRQNNKITIVSGLPRSGTSMVMNMLQAGGMEILSDHIRQADPDNPQGYFEFERVKNLKQGDSAWLKMAQGKAVKVISYLLTYLPKEYTYHVIFLERDLDEVLASQRAMLLRKGNDPEAQDDQKMAQIFSHHLEEVKDWLARQRNVRVLFLHYAEVMRDPRAKAHEIAAFLNLPLDEAAMAAIPDVKLHRQRKAASRHE